MTPATYAGDIEHVVPQEIVRKIDGRVVRISPLVTAELPRFIGIVVPLMATLPSFGPGFFRRLREEQLDDIEIMSMLTLLSVNGAELIDLVILCTRAHEIPSPTVGGEPQRVTGEAHAAWVRGLLIDRTLDLSATAILVNADFFKRAMSQIRATASHLMPAAADAVRAARSATPKPSSS